ncbi:MAG: hypothetical protein JXR97_04490 [Planctomycetes bacterium]|nr:hypothetical protein [Planctomycetota bacterium]
MAILTIDKMLGSLREGARVALCAGCFEYVHAYTLKALQSVKDDCDVLVVSVSDNLESCSIPASDRAGLLETLPVVDFVVISHGSNSAELIRKLRPVFYGDFGLVGDGSQLSEDEQAAISDVGAKLCKIEATAAEHIGVVRSQRDLYDSKTRSYLCDFGKKWGTKELFGYLDGMGSVKALVIGDAIIDEYQFCQTMGKSGKFPVLAARHLYTEKYAGGIMAIANHVSGLDHETHMLTMLGQEAPQDGFICENLLGGVGHTFIYKPGVPTVVKRRFLEEYHVAKLFEVYEMRNEDVWGEEEDELIDALEKLLPQFDLVLVADFGHGMLGERAIHTICEKAKFLALNVQTNAGNKGYNFVTKYPRADFISIDEPGARLEMRNRRADLCDLVSSIAERMNCRQMIVTRGSNGSLCYDADAGFSQVPAFAIKVVDAMGAGDAFLSVASLAATKGAPIEVSTFLGNVAGAIACGVVGNKEPVRESEMRNWIEQLI